jgi:hypothetical protein
MALKLHIKFFFVILFIVISNIGLQGQCNLKNTTFNTGEKLKYTAFYNLQFIWLEVADIELSTSNIYYMGKNCIKLKSLWKTRPKYDWIMHVDDYYEAIIDADSIIAFEYKQKIIEGKYFSDARYSYNHQKKMVYAWIENKQLGKKYDSIPINNCIFDFLTSIYYIRNLNYPKCFTNQRISYSAILGNKINKLELKYAGIETVKPKNGKSIICHKIKPSIAETEMFKGGKDNLSVWFSEDKNQVPIMAESELFIGSVKLVLKSYEGTKHPAKY